MSNAVPSQPRPTRPPVQPQSQPQPTTTGGGGGGGGEREHQTRQQRREKEGRHGGSSSNRKHDSEVTSVGPWRIGKTVGEGSSGTSRSLCTMTCSRAYSDPLTFDDQVASSWQNTNIPVNMPPSRSFPNLTLNVIDLKSLKR